MIKNEHGNEKDTNISEENIKKETGNTDPEHINENKPEESNEETGNDDKI